VSISCTSIQNAYDELEKENPTSEQLKNINNTVEAVKYLQGNNKWDVEEYVKKIKVHI